ncbi:MAG: tripartite tricarboxylate transporter TctB family protein [Rhodobacteraceae bacterium]|jgi:putative tricarboxylic transport membrane protein|uniref:Putative tricarboxylic transport membrane protein n=1 Tax=Salipiger profundus TaxID=1229727 RepID=A0A1U7DCJ3_9RHOB|nr:MULTISPECIES: tripartite tricarboxylate transporter TctB family protein [Salipiger]APX25859.1 putative tricarboxylic transport membrane protein [Salipiger profundus]MAB05114.1 tripartite tricarboxylate transporter TctB family protein [Paracoccaceae bacterium]SFC80761.1 putative tricarboxylic transport membrane protein [Salipiger profundus]
MADRIFAAVLLAVSIGYAVIAFTVISAPFQYDPLGPESWPQILSVVAILCLLGILWKPDTNRLDVTKRVWFRLATAVVMLLAYGDLYEPLGFVLSTILFGTLMALMLGAPKLRALGFGVAAGIFGWLLCVTLMDLNLPEGALIEYLLEATTADQEGGN